MAAATRNVVDCNRCVDHMTELDASKHRIGEPYSNAEGGKCGIVLKGTLGLELNDRSFTIGTGDSFAFPGQAMVRFWNVGEEECEVVSPATV